MKKGKIVAVPVAPAADEDFDHGHRDGVAAEQDDVGVVVAAHLEGERVAAAALARDGTDAVLLVVVGRYFLCTRRAFVAKSLGKSFH